MDTASVRAKRVVARAAGASMLDILQGEAGCGQGRQRGRQGTHRGDPGHLRPQHAGQDQRGNAAHQHGDDHVGKFRPETPDQQAGDQGDQADGGDVRVDIPPVVQDIPGWFHENGWCAAGSARESA